jgi:galacturonokinase
MIEDASRRQAIRDEAARRFRVKAESLRVVRSPYRICPLGAHIDHQLGPVTALALDQSVLLAYAPADSAHVRLSSLDFERSVEFSLDHVPGRRPGDWGNFARGGVLALQRRHRLARGIVGVISGKLHGGGVSSSAAVGVALLLALEDANDLCISPEENIKLDQEIENGYLGLRNGILDQSAILLSRRGQLTRIDCATAAHELIPPGEGMPPFRILLAFSGLREALVGTDYNRRVEECAAAAQSLLTAAGRNEAAPVLGNVTAAEYAAHRHRLEGALARRAAHFFSEVERVEQGVAAWGQGDLVAFGALMTASGESSIRNYECGSPPLIDLYEILIQTPGVYGARFSGAGFRGCCVALVNPGLADQAAAHVREQYLRLHPDLRHDASVVLCDSDDGAEVIP